MKQLNADVVVIAAGISGLAAAITAAENGARVIAFEKNSTTGGAANMGMGPLGIGSRFQKNHLIGLTPGEAFRRHMSYTHWKVDARLVRDYYFKSGDTINWLEDMGVEFLEATRYYSVTETIRPYGTSEDTWHIVKPTPNAKTAGPRAASTMIKIMTERAEELGVDIRLNTPVKKIIKEDGKVVGVIAQDKDGEQIEARAKAVIIATGGAGDEPEMIKKDTGFTWGKNLFSFRIPGTNGEGMKMAWEVGAEKTDLSLEIMFVVPDNMNHFIVDGAFRQPCLWVNSEGERFLNEDAIGNTTFTGNAISIQPGSYCYSIFDSALLRHYKKDGPDIVSHVHPPDLFDHFEEAVNADIANGYEHVFVADTIEELAGKLGIAYEALKKTIDEYNDMCAKGHDEIFEKEHRYMQPIQKGKFYACRFFPGAYGTLGGIKINYKTEVLTPEGKAIPGLYAVGVDACNIYGDSYPFILPGNTMGFCLNSGRIAGENAVRYISEQE